MKCSGKQHSYPSEIEQKQREIREQKFNDVANQTEINGENLKALDEKMKTEVKRMKSTLESYMANMIDKLDKINRQQSQLISQVKYLSPTIEFSSGPDCLNRHWSGSPIRLV